jgi:hypothetical protein
MTNPLRIAWNNYADTAVLSANSEVGSLPVAYLKDLDLGKIWRASSTAAAWVLADLGASLEIGMVALIGTNLAQTDAAQVRISTADATGAAGDAYDSGPILAAVDPMLRRFVHPVDPGVTGRYVRIDLSQAEVPEAGRLVVMRTWAPSRNFQFGWSRISRDPSRRIYSEGRNLFSDRRQVEQGFRFTLRGLTVDEAYVELDPLTRAAGTSQDVLVCRDIEAADLGAASVWGPFEVTVEQEQREEGYMCEIEVWSRS